MWACFEGVPAISILCRQNRDSGFQELIRDFLGTVRRWRLLSESIIAQRHAVPLHPENRGDFPSFRISTFPDLEIPTSEKYRDFWYLGTVSAPEQYVSMI